MERYRWGRLLFVHKAHLRTARHIRFGVFGVRRTIRGNAVCGLYYRTPLFLIACLYTPPTIAKNALFFLSVRVVFVYR